MVSAGSTCCLFHHRSVGAEDTAQVVHLPHLPHTFVAVGKPQTPVVSIRAPGWHNLGLGVSEVGAVVRAVVAVVVLAAVLGLLGPVGGAVRGQHAQHVDWTVWHA